jgi:DNA-binding XRE family transcriptional regulator
MELLPALRRYLALTQARMAELLGVVRENIVRAESGQRPLPAPAQVALAALLAALPPATLAALAQQPMAALPEALPPPPPLPDPGSLAAHRYHLRRELGRREAALAAHEAAAAWAAARLALLAAPRAPDLGAGHSLLELEARQWTDAFAEAARLLLRARCEGLRRELAVLEGAA